MRYTVTLLLCLSTLASVPLAAAPKPSAWQSSFDAGMQALKAGRYAEAERKLLAAQRLVDKKGREDRRLALTLSGLGDIYRKAGKFTRAEPLIKRALSIANRTAGPKSPEAATMNNNLAVLYLDWGKPSLAAPLLRKCIGIREGLKKPRDLDTSIPLANLAGIYSDKGDYAQAEVLLRQALKSAERRFGKYDPHVATISDRLGVHYLRTKEYAKAKPLIQRALSIRQAKLGARHPDVARSFQSLAGILIHQGRDQEAEGYLHKALSIMEGALGPSCPPVAEILEDLAAMRLDNDAYAEALPLVQRAAAVREKIWGAKDPDTLAAHRMLDFVQEAVDLIAQSAEWRSEYDEASRHMRSDELEEAKPHLVNALARAEAIGRDDPRLLLSLRSLAAVHFGLGERAEAASLQARAVSVAERLNGPASQTAASCAAALARTYMAVDRHVDAEPLLRRAITIREETDGGDHIRMA